MARKRYKPVLVPSDSGTDRQEADGAENHLFFVQGPLPSGRIKAEFLAWAVSPVEVRLFADVPGGGPAGESFSLGLAGPEEEALSAFLLLPAGASRVRIAAADGRTALRVKGMVLTRVWRAQIFFSMLFGLLGRQKLSARLLFALFCQCLAVLWTGGFGDLRARLARMMDARTEQGDRYASWLIGNTPGRAELESLRIASAELPSKPLFLILLPVLEEAGPSLRRSVASIEAQVYPFWRLCIMAPTRASASMGAVLEGFKAIEAKVQVVYGEKDPPLSGDFICLLSEHAVLAPEALAECAARLNEAPDTDCLYTDEDRIDEHGRRSLPFFKPDWSPEYLESFPYFSGFACYRTAKLKETGWLENAGVLPDAYDLALRFTELTQKIGHIPKVLCHRSLEDSEPGVDGERAIASLEGRLRRLGVEGAVSAGPFPGLYETRRNHLVAPPLVSIVIPAAGRRANIRGVQTDLLSHCITSIRERSTYRNYEIVVVHDGNLDQAACDLVELHQGRLIAFKGKFNFSAKVNLGARHARGAHLLFLNDDTEVISEDWLSAMVQFSRRSGIGAVGAKLYFGDGTVQHGGVTFNRDGLPDHLCRGAPGTSPGYFYNLAASKNCLAVTGACLMTPKAVFEKLGGLDEELAVNYNDVDYCLRAAEAGYRTVFAPRAELFHFESKSRINLVGLGEIRRFARRWHGRIRQDPYYNINLESSPADFRIKVRP